MTQLLSAKRIVIKIGSSILIDETGKTYRQQWLESFAEDIKTLQDKKTDIIIVTSGAVGMGRFGLDLGSKKLKLEEKQAAAAYGQISLAAAYRQAFANYGLKVAQVLLTPEDTENRRRHLNARSTIETLLTSNVIPIINENDTVATDELRFGDNDRLSARVAQMIKADLLILFSDVDGLYSANPATDKNAKHIVTVDEITSQIEQMAGGASSLVGTGGMASKIMAAKIATASGTAMIVAKGSENNPLAKLLSGNRHTYFNASKSGSSARKMWISATLKAQGAYVIDDGAEKALLSGKSLLPAGVKSVSGNFERGDAVKILASNGNQVGVGISAYSSVDAEKIIGRKSSEIESILGYLGREEIIHRDDLATNFK